MDCYADNSATTQPTQRVMDAMTACMRGTFYNPSALYGQALEARHLLDDCRSALCRAIHAPKDARAVFTGCGTEADNLAIIGHLSACHDKGRVVYSAGEHPAVKEACLQAQKLGFEAVEAPLDGFGLPDLAALEALLTPDTRLICMMQVNNETGAVYPMDAIAGLRAMRCPSAALHVDGVQGFLRVPFDMKALGVTSYALSGHKIHAPKGVGALVFDKSLRLSPILFGGGQESGLRSGTENTPGIAGLLEAVREYPAQNDMRRQKLLLLDALKAGVPALRVNGPDPASDASAPHILNVSFPPVRAETLLHALEADGVCVGNGSACSSRKNTTSAVLRAMNVPQRAAQSALRFSLCPYLTDEQILYASQRACAHYDILKKFERR